MNSNKGENILTIITDTDCCQYCCQWSIGVGSIPLTMLSKTVFLLSYCFILNIVILFLLLHVSLT